MLILAHSMLRIANSDVIKHMRHIKSIIVASDRLSRTQLRFILDSSAVAVARDFTNKESWLLLKEITYPFDFNSQQGSYDLLVN